MVTRKQFPRYVKFTNAKDALKYECPISLTAMYQPLTIKDSEPKHTFSGPVLREFTRTNKFDPLNDMPLQLEALLEDFKFDAEMSNAMCIVPLVNGGKYFLFPALLRFRISFISTTQALINAYNM